MNVRSIQAICAAAALWAGPAAAGDAPCPAWARSDAPRMERVFPPPRWEETAPPRPYGPRLDAPMWVWTRGAWFHVPVGYLNPWAGMRGEEPPGLDVVRARLRDGSDGVGYDPETERFDPARVAGVHPQSVELAFWHPSGRAVERRVTWGMSWRPCEAGRPAPPPGAHVVRAEIRWAGGPEADSLDAAIFARAADAPPGRDGAPDDPLQALMKCDHGMCRGRVRDRRTGFVLWLHVPWAEGAPRDAWRGPAETALRLVESWRRPEGPPQDDAGR